MRKSKGKSEADKSSSTLASGLSRASRSNEIKRLGHAGKRDFLSNKNVF
jgi:hypothetical protein